MPFMTGHRHMRAARVNPCIGAWIACSAALFLRGARCIAWVSVAQAEFCSAPNGGTLRITGEVSHPIVLHEVVLHEADLAMLSRQTVHVVDDKGAAVTTRVYRWPNCWACDAPLGKQLRGSRMKLYVVVEAADGYRAVFTLAEFNPDFTDRVILLDGPRDGHPLSCEEGPSGSWFPARSVMPVGAGGNRSGHSGSSIRRPQEAR